LSEEAFLFGAMTIGDLLIALSFLCYQLKFSVGKAIFWALLSGVFEGVYFVTLAFDLKQSQLDSASCESKILFAKSGERFSPPEWLVTCLL
jgi:hypothetical protein